MDADVLELALKAPFSVLAVFTTLILALTFCSVQLFRYGPAIRKLNQIEVLSQLYYLAETQREMTRSFGAATAASNATRQSIDELRSELDGLRDFIVEAREKMSEYNADSITRARLQEEGKSCHPSTDGLFPARNSPEQLFARTKSEWARFVEVFKRRLEDANITPQLNRIGKMTYMLTDKRRRRPLPIETADLITALHSQYRRYLALRAITPLEHDNFVQLVETAIRELEAPSRQGELELPANGSADFRPTAAQVIN